ncbi:MAG TPA: tRNA (adenosine(37)-N6)-dimethylallyltransferase MiaA [Puia sp.]|nr:tRNA (adenosine(37)-N6)-dimethylallyltransferase MiaA [Puia sp.]
MFPKTVIIISGPTASGKTALAMELARHFNTSIISADSRQCFRELDIGVAKPSPLQLSEVKHYFINSHSIRDEVNASIFESLALSWCEEIFSGHDTVVMCGGTGLYIRAFREGLDEIPPINEGIRKKITDQYQNQGITWLQQSLQHSDPLFYESGEITNPQRMMRALEVIQSTGRSIITYRNLQKKQRNFRMLEFGIRLPRKELYQRIDHRVDEMMSKGLLEEAGSLLPYQHLNALQTVGYTELFQHLQGKSGLEEAVSLIKQNTRHYAKRQITWLNKNEHLIWLEGDFKKNVLDAYKDIKI